MREAAACRRSRALHGATMREAAACLFFRHLLFETFRLRILSTSPFSPFQVPAVAIEAFRWVALKRLVDEVALREEGEVRSSLRPATCS